ncbi:MAG: hypothetical protein OQK04_09060 [Kangiellaceae bacterium]|nr:hypothetical protein [Kangiellaceae bacterium]MCW8998849.1 hypothetical protein [Kangiellaceae bacterium]
MNKTIICLANSRKLSGRCIAGKEFTNNIIGEWIRPVSERASHEISEKDRRYENGSRAQVFDIIDIEYKGHENHPVQRENYVIDDRYYWAKTSSYSGNLNALLDNPMTLWSNDSSYNGVNDRISSDSITQPIQTLYFISPEKLEIVVQIEGAEFNNGKKKVRARFEYLGVNYFIAVTDPIIEQTYLASGEGTYPVSGTSYMTISLGYFDGYWYKLAALIR